MRFIILLLALLITLIAPKHFANKYRLFIEKYFHMLGPIIAKRSNNPWVTYSFLVLIPITVIYLFMGILNSGFGLLINFIFEICVLSFCLGLCEANHELLTGHFNKDESPRNIILNANTCLLPTVLIYIAFGPILTMAYKITDEFKHLGTSANNHTLKHNCTFIIESIHWITIRIACLFYALMGDFNKTFTLFKDYLRKNISDNELFNQQMADIIATQAQEDSPIALTRDMVIRTLFSILTLFALYKIQFGIR